MSISDDSEVGGAATPAPATKKDPPYPSHLTIEKPPYRPGVMRVPIDRYYKQEYHDLELERVWKKSWQWACREDDIPEVGDYHVYEVATLSFVIVRTGPKEFKAYWNSCPHRGRRLCDFSGKRASEIRCMFHGWAWNIDGTMKDMPSGWDFPGTRDESSRLLEARTGVWGGFVFINPDPECESLEDFIGELPLHFEGAGIDLGKRWTQVHVIADLACNWKVAQEGFLESWHVYQTHPQIVRPAGDKNVAGMRWDDFGNWMRNAPALPTDEHRPPPGFSTIAQSEQDIIDQRWGFHRNEEPPIKVEPGQKAVDIIKKVTRDFHKELMGDRIDDYHDYHLSGGEMVHLWPNLHPWGGFSRIVYRFRPYRDDPERSLMDIMYLAPWPEDRPIPPPATPHRLEPGQDPSFAPELGQLSRIFQQDMANLPNVQLGLRSSKQGYIILSSHNEAPVRHWHDLYNKWMGFENGDYLANKEGA